MRSKNLTGNKLPVTLTRIWSHRNSQKVEVKCSVAYILSFVITTTLNIPAQGKFPSLLVQITRGCSLICFLIQFLIKRKSFDERSSVCFHPGIYNFGKYKESHMLPACCSFIGRLCYPRAQNSVSGKTHEILVFK